MLLAIKRDHLPVVKLLHMWKAKLDEDAHGNAPIVLAAQKGNPEIVEFLASHTDNNNGWGLAYIP